MSLPTDLDFDEAMESSYQYSGLKPLMDQNEESRRSKYQLRSLVMSIAVLAAIAAATVLLYAGIQPTQQKGLLATDILAASSIGDSETSSKPNIIFILADDMGFNSITPAVAPTLYALQESGIRLSTYYAQETCTPGRAALLTGRYPLSVGLQYYECTVDTAGGLSLEETLFSEVLQDGGYTTYMFGKWNLGNSSPLYLPTARGFSYYLGYLDGFTNYWSKLIPDFTTYTDLLWSNSECYYMYDANDVSLYSTHLYGDKAVAAIKYHNYEKPLFMYLAFQAVHDPFSDVNSTHGTGVPKSYMTDEAYTYIEATYPGTMEFQYMKSLNVLDTAVADVINQLVASGVMNNTYILFASDNGGCPGGGGRNAPLRGTKGSLFEGGVHVEAFISSPLLAPVSPMNYSGLFHVTDWFPTILSMANLSFTPADGYALDGFDHYSNIIGRLNGRQDAREYLLVNYYMPDTVTATSLWTGYPFAIMNRRYKLIHTYNNSAGAWYSDATVYSSYDDEVYQFADCGQGVAVASGEFTYYLFDLLNDPYETKNIYNATDYKRAIQDELYAQLAVHISAAADQQIADTDESCYLTWDDNSMYAVPWDIPADSPSPDYPANCGLYSTMSEIDSAALPAFLAEISIAADPRYIEV